MRNTLALLAALLPSLAAAQAEAPKYSLTASNEVVEGAWRPKLVDENDWDLGLAFKAGALAVSQSYTPFMPVLLPSTYINFGGRLVHTGSVEFMAAGTVGVLNLNSQRAAGAYAGSPANALDTQEKFSQNWRTTSWYLDGGKVLSFSEQFKGAVFLSAQGFNAMLPGGTDLNNRYLMDTTGGAMVMAKSGKNEVSAFAAARLDPVRGNAYRNDGSLEWVPTGKAGIEGARQVGAGKVAVGVEGQDSRADTGLRPYARYADKTIEATLAGDFRKSKNPFIPDVSGGGADVQAFVTPAVKLGLSASMRDERYQGAPDPYKNTAVMAGITFNLDNDAVVKSEMAWRRSMSQRFDNARAVALNDALPDSTYATRFRNILQNSPTMGDFVENSGVRTTDDVLSALSAFTSSFSRWNYNFKEGNPPNVDDPDELYKRARASALGFKKDGILVCIGSAQFTAILAEQLGKQAGIDIRAAQVTVMVPDESGKQAGHAVAMVRTPDRGLVFVDWGWLTPTGTFRTEDALRVYQALVGIPAVTHEITDASREGRHVGYLYSAEGKLLVKTLSYQSDEQRGRLERLFDDNPTGDSVTIERYRNILQHAFKH